MQGSTDRVPWRPAGKPEDFRDKGGSFSCSVFISLFSFFLQFPFNEESLQRATLFRNTKPAQMPNPTSAPTKNKKERGGGGIRAPASAASLTRMATKGEKKKRAKEKEPEEKKKIIETPKFQSSACLAGLRNSEA